MSCKCDFGAGGKTCHCAACHATFTSVSAFDMHQRLSDDGVMCLDPAVMVKRDGVTAAMTVCRKTPDGFPVWGDHRPDVPRFNSWA